MIQNAACASWPEPCYSERMQRLYLNIGGYKGEGIDIQGVLRRMDHLALATGWEWRPIDVEGQAPLPAYHRPGRAARRRLYLSSGIHGDEPAGPTAMLELFLRDDWPAELELWAVPCLNPEGFRLNRRGDQSGVDLNRDYLCRQTAFVRGHIAWLEAQPSFDASLLLHEDWEAPGFYVYELNPDHRPSLAPAILRAVQAVCPVDLSPTIEEREARGGVIRANTDLHERTDWPEAFYLVHAKTRLNYTLESPSDFPLATRVNALTTGVRAACQALREPTEESGNDREDLLRAPQRA